MDLIERARDELTRLDEDPDLIEPLLKIVKAFEDQGFDGLARGFAVEYLHLLLRGKPLSVLTDAPNEWERKGTASGRPLWRSLRDPEAYSKDEGKTFWLLSDVELCDPEPPMEYVSADHTQVMLPETYRDALKLTSQEQSDLVESSGGVDDAVGEG